LRDAATRVQDYVIQAIPISEAYLRHGLRRGRARDRSARPWQPGEGALWGRPAGRLKSVARLLPGLLEIGVRLGHVKLDGGLPALGCRACNHRYGAADLASGDRV